MKRNTPEDFWNKVDLGVGAPGECWLWLGCIDPGGYGQWRLHDRGVLAHRVSWEIFNGCCIPAGLHIDHLCRNRACVNPAHLEAVTPQENLRRAMALYNQRTTCRKGHLFSVSPGEGGKRRCMICRRAQRRVWARNKRQEVCCEQ